ncbi:carbohydrate ABC transporter permease [Paenibacillus sp. FSL K6-0276]|uniref:carbohydrate ABC transporter permease n=1 Tax=unclassified Paenibacillus TaxID=185978 RepID=UPI0028A782A9|nr:carbohydrate ABC transporter permease [Paenibacillus sp.]
MTTIGVQRHKLLSPQKVNHLLIHIILISLGLVMTVPFIWMLSSSLKPEVDIFKMPIEWIPSTITWSNYAALFSERFNFGLFYKNTFIIASSVTILQLITCSLAGYAFSKIKFKGRDTIFLCYLGTMMVPFQVTMIPLFIIMRILGLVDTQLSIILMSAFSAYGVFLLRQFYLTLPIEISEAAMIDGCNHFQIYYRIMLPNIIPAMSTLILFTFLGQWNDFIVPFIFLNSPENFTITIGLKAFVSDYDVEFGKIMAGTAMSIIPILAIFFAVQKQFIEGVALSGIKG